MRKQRIIYAFFALIALPAIGNAVLVIAEKAEISLVDARSAAVLEPPEHRVFDVVIRNEARESLVPARSRRSSSLVPPISDARSRVTKKHFGMEIHPETSPVPGDKFDGFHVGTDFETFEDEKDVDVPVFAICDGPLAFKQAAKGYGGLAVQSCRIEDEDVSVIYGHLRLASISAVSGSRLNAGDAIGVLGTGESEETDGVRKHLHLGVYLGPHSEQEFRGYVKEYDETFRWLDPQALLWPEDPPITE